MYFRKQICFAKENYFSKKESNTEAPLINHLKFHDINISHKEEKKSNQKMKTGSILNFVKRKFLGELL